VRYFFDDAHHLRRGPYTLEELRQLHWTGQLHPETPVFPEGSLESIPFKDLWAQQPAAGSPFSGPPPLPHGRETSMESFTQRAGADLRALLPHLLLPFEELRAFRWLENRKALSMAAVGLVPLVIYAFFAQRGDIANAYWAIAFYFSALWGLFFYHVFPTPQARLSTAALCFFGTGAVSITLLLLAYRVWPLNQLGGFIGPSAGSVSRLAGFVLGVGVPEEACKALVLFFVVKRYAPLAPQSMLFYGLLSGLGFGIYEGVNYQFGRNFLLAGSTPEYYLLNLIRLTTLPFLHAIWTGMAGYFIGFAAAYPRRRRGLIIVALGLPALLHGLYDTLSGNFLGLLVALISVVMLVLYLAKSQDFEQLLQGRGR
jgi:RsiW-degrading membrane proteinase PrsW (M82 family)